MRIQPTLFALVLISSLSQGCQTSQFSSDKENPYGQSTARIAPNVVASSPSQTGQLESKYNSIARGMTGKEVASILGREYDQCLLPGGSLGNEWRYWFEDNATIFVDFEWASGQVCNKTLTPTNGKEKL